MVSSFGGCPFQVELEEWVDGDKIFGRQECLVVFQEAIAFHSDVPNDRIRRDCVASYSSDAVLEPEALTEDKVVEAGSEFELAFCNPHSWLFDE
jgi:hypothetical protein